MLAGSGSPRDVLAAVDPHPASHAPATADVAGLEGLLDAASRCGLALRVLEIDASLARTSHVEGTEGAADLIIRAHTRLEPAASGPSARGGGARAVQAAGSGMMTVGASVPQGGSWAEASARVIERTRAGKLRRCEQRYMLALGPPGGVAPLPASAAGERGPAGGGARAVLVARGEEVGEDAARVGAARARADAEAGGWVGAAEDRGGASVASRRRQRATGGSQPPAPALGVRSVPRDDPARAAADEVALPFRETARNAHRPGEASAPLSRAGVAAPGPGPRRASGTVADGPLGPRQAPAGLITVELGDDGGSGGGSSDDSDSAGDDDDDEGMLV